MKILDVPQSGSYAGVTHSRNRYGQYRRTRAVPVNPQSDRQATVRGRLADLAANWRDLTDNQREAWVELGAQIARTDSLGQSYTLTGLQAYLLVNANKLNVGEVEEATAPLYLEPAQPTLALTTVQPSTLSLTVSGPQNDAHVLIFASGPKSPGVRYCKDLRQVKNYTMVAGGVVNLLADYSALFGAPQEGARIFFKVVEVSAEGFASPPYFADTLVAADP